VEGLALVREEPPRGLAAGSRRGLLLAT